MKWTTMTFLDIILLIEIIIIEDAKHHTTSRPQTTITRTQNASPKYVND